RARMSQQPERFSAIFDEMDRISLAGADALQAGRYEDLGGLMNVCHGYLNAIGVSTTELESMVALARGAGALGAKLTGGGGGGSIVALCPGRESAVTEALQNAGYAIVTAHG
ncbi:MAG: hydroxymethylglutaryl-CoA reductase, partial [Pseudomonadota bacterium]